MVAVLKEIRPSLAISQDTPPPGLFKRGGEGFRMHYCVGICFSVWIQFLTIKVKLNFQTFKGHMGGRFAVVQNKFL